MVLWQSDLRISWRAQWFSLLLHGVVAALVLLVPWPLSYTPIWLLLLSLVVFDCVRSPRRIHARRGQHLWLAADSMDAGEWRDLRRLVLQKPAQE